MGDDMNFSYSIMMAIFCFPFLSIVLSLPFLIYYYRKYGSISFFRFILFFSFFFYLLCTYFLVILPLPPRSSVAHYTSVYYNLKPFYFVSDFITSDVFDPKNISSFLLIFKNSRYLEAIFNILMVIPFGIYLRYYFKCGFFKTLFLSFCLSLFFELTQLTGLYFIYPRPYRLCDINDLINNTLGGVIGFVICPLLSFFLPSRDKLDMKDYIKGSYVSIGRRTIALVIDYSLIICLSAVYGFIFDFNHIKIVYIIINFIYFVFVSCFFDGFTFGKWLVNYKTVTLSIGEKVSFWVLLLKWFLLHLFILNGWVFVIIYRNRVGYGSYWVIVLYLCIFGFFFFHALFSWIVKKRLFYDYLFKLDSMSIIEEEYDEEYDEEDF